MYCPKCSHQSASNNARYCPGCGFWLQGVAELIAKNGVFALDGEEAPKPRRSMVKRGALLGATLMFISFFLTLAILPHAGKKGPVLVVFFFYWVALMALINMSGYLKRLITKIFSEELSPSKKIASPRGPALPAAYSAPVLNSGRQIVDTSKMAQPSSITEQTTSRFNKV
jgi:hypothetical protein